MHSVYNKSGADTSLDLAADAADAHAKLVRAFGGWVDNPGAMLGLAVGEEGDEDGSVYYRDEEATALRCDANDALLSPFKDEAGIAEFRARFAAVLTLAEHRELAKVLEGFVEKRVKRLKLKAHRGALDANAVLDQRKEVVREMLSAAAHGIRVVPVYSIDEQGRCTCLWSKEQKHHEDHGDDVPYAGTCTGSPGKHPIGDKWQDVATRDLEVITRRLEHRRFGTYMNWGVVYGPDDGLMVFDFDGPEGCATFARWRADGTLPATVVTKTGSGGYHALLRVPPGWKIQNSVKQIPGAVGVDVRGENGMSVGAGSRHPSGTRYAWLEGCGLADLPIADAPIELLHAAYFATAKDHGVAPDGTVAPPGSCAARARLEGDDHPAAAASPAHAGSAGFGTVAPKDDGWRVKLAEIGDGEGQRGYDSPIYDACCSFFGRNGVNCDPGSLKAAIIARIDELPARGGDKAPQSRYRDADYLDGRVRAAMAFIAANPRETRAAADKPAAKSGPAPFKDLAEAKAAIALLTAGDAPGASMVIARLAVSGLGAIADEALVNEIAALTKFSKTALRKDLKAAGSAPSSDEEFFGAYNDPEIIEKLEWMNTKYAGCQMGGRYRVLREPAVRGDGPDLIEKGAIADLMAGQLVEVTDDKGETKKKPLFNLWHNWSERRTYERGVVFEPGGCGRDAYNLWQGFKVKPVEGDWSLLHGHIKDNVCQGNADYFDWLITWMAQLVQQPGVKLGSAVALLGLKGTGKSKVCQWFQELFGAHAMEASNAKHITGGFNGHQMGIILMVCEEAFWGGDKLAGGILKNLITSPKMVLEGKYLDAITVTNHMRLMFVSNEAWVVPASFGDERRFMVLKCGEDRRNDTEFFAAIDMQMKAGGLEAMLFDLLAWKPPFEKGWDVLRTPPATPWLSEQAAEGVTPIEKVLVQIADDGGYRVLTGEVDGWGTPVSNWVELAEFVDTDIPVKHLREFVQRQIGRTAQNETPAILRAAKKLWKMEKPPGNKQVSSEKKVMHCYTVPPLSEIREHLTELRLLHGGA